MKKKFIRKEQKTQKTTGKDKVYSREELETVMNEKQKRFALYWVQEPNATIAYKKAYNKQNDNMAGVSGFHLLRNPKVQQYIEFLKKDLAHSLGLTKEGLIHNLREIAYAKLTDLYDGDWITRKEFETLKQNHPELTRAIRKVNTKVVRKTDNVTGEPYTEEYCHIELIDSLKATEMLFKVMGWNEPDKVAITVEQPLFPDID